jgi:pimeloyl-ACP methyl ester carboxylesterase
MMRVPVYFTQGLRQGRSLENRDLAARLTLPVAIVVGGKDRSMPFAALEGVASQLPKGEYWLFESAGHAVSTDTAGAFNVRLASFADRVFR